MWSLSSGYKVVIPPGASSYKEQPFWEEIAGSAQVSPVTLI